MVPDTFSARIQFGSAMSINRRPACVFIFSVRAFGLLQPEKASLAEVDPKNIEALGH